MRELLTDTANKYMGLINELGVNPDESAFIKKISELFSEQVVKIENGKKTVEGQKALTSQLQNARSHAFPLTLEILGILCDKEQLRYVSPGTHKKWVNI